MPDVCVIHLYSEAFTVPITVRLHQDFVCVATTGADFEMFNAKMAVLKYCRVKTRNI